ncbi:ermin [Ictidomys tridecemlineatus]|uniref:Ermin n=1 Tax=Ictidomys tridecemlineatus TaxID=43179 RepID=I3M879_ICTTR|nr:ermin [Ictidomys tridecemlineatus]KAG3274501.1 ermin [Ictidomys tridecemlineatus]
MTDVPGTFSGAECNGDSLPETVQQPTTKINEDATDMDRTPPDYRVEPGPEDVPTKGNQEERGKSQGNILLNCSMDEKILKENPEDHLFIVHKAITDLSLQETSAKEMTFGEGHQWEKIPLSSSNQEINSPKERIAKQPLEERENEDRKNKAHQAAEIEWLGFRKPSEVDMLHSQHGEQEEVWNEEAPEDNDDDYNDDEDEVRVIEFKKKYEEGSQFKEEMEASEDSPLSSPGSQPVTPDEQPTLGKKGDISRNAYSRYNTISYRKIRKGNTKQRIDEFESMMHL